MKSGKKIIIIGSAHPLRGGGISTFNERLAQAFMERGDETVIFSFRLQYPSIFFPGKTQWTTEPPPEGLDIRARINSVNPFNWIRTGREISRLRPDLVIIRFWLPFLGPCLGVLARIIKRNRITRIITIADNIIPHERKLFDQFLTAFYVKSSDGFVFMSRSVMQDLDRFDRNKPRRYCPHPLYDVYGTCFNRQTACEMLGIDQKYHYLLFFGFIREYKGLDILLHALGNKRLKSLPVRLLLAGEYYTDPEPYEQIIEQHQIGDRILKFAQFIPNSEVGTYFCAADLVVQPYKSATQSGVTQVAYYFDKPMIITNVGGLAEMVPDRKAGYVVDPDPDKVAEAIEDFFVNKREKEFVPFVREAKKKYSWENMLLSITELEKEIENRKDPGS